MQKKIIILKSVFGTSSRNNTKTLPVLILYRSLIRSLLDYGCEAYDSASESSKKVLNSIQYMSFHICVGTLHGTSLATLKVEMNEPSLDLGKMLNEKYHIHLSRVINHLGIKTTYNPLLAQLHSPNIH